jgi:hypothetical protein
MLEADDKEELKEYIKKIKAELSQVSSEVCVCVCVCVRACVCIQLSDHIISTSHHHMIT